MYNFVPVILDDQRPVIWYGVEIYASKTFPLHSPPPR